MGLPVPLPQKTSWPWLGTLKGACFDTIPEGGVPLCGSFGGERHCSSAALVPAPQGRGHTNRLSFLLCAHLAPSQPVSQLGGPSWSLFLSL